MAHLRDKILAMKKLSLALLLGCALLGCPDKAETKPDPAAAPAKTATPAAASASAAPKAGGGW